MSGTLVRNLTAHVFLYYSEFIDSAQYTGDISGGGGGDGVGLGPLLSAAVVVMM